MTTNDLGYDLIENFIFQSELTAILEETKAALLSEKGGGIRNAEKKFRTILAFAQSSRVIKCAERFLSGQPQLARAILFNKRPGKNWLVTWHQDKTIALSSRFNKSGWGPWSLKDGAHCVQPPSHVLDNMIALRVHLDESTAANGALKLIPGSHNRGILNQEQIDQFLATRDAITIEAPRASALAMRPLILHASSKAHIPTTRRVLHLEYSAAELPAGVTWA
ncbi:phytanoyl-CoA dioxygenase family protein [Simiduia curdlanivorans]|uniref:Phytanoyl-CoA dioxygenase family protein n=1 Tax=Simiduia curdlanivorans TaxID=1492769 RepID=A0ABV8V094_9GAMM|nr:phytanoyl-CoA dioxygenase family protein [Simiduia curdlanivorans]MDN3637840.1 phytanoyl-CoA dioxygenase family protein [Simiduia curdlanivorans]